MTLSFTSKSEQQSARLRDAFRILAWQAYKRENQVGGLKAYEMFKSEWENHEIQTYELQQLIDLGRTLEYSQVELLQIRSEYYQNRDRNSNITDLNSEEVPY